MCGGDTRGAYSLSEGEKPEGKSPFGIGIDGDNIKMGLKEIGWEDVDWTDLAQDGDRWRVFVNSNEASSSV